MDLSAIFCGWSHNYHRSWSWLCRLGSCSETSHSLPAYRKVSLIKPAPLKAMIDIGRQDKIIFDPYEWKQPLIEIWRDQRVPVDPDILAPVAPECRWQEVWGHHRRHDLLYSRADRSGTEKSGIFRGRCRPSPGQIMDYGSGKKVKRELAFWYKNGNPSSGWIADHDLASTGGFEPLTYRLGGARNGQKRSFLTTFQSNMHSNKNEYFLILKAFFMSRNRFGWGQLSSNWPALNGSSGQVLSKTRKTGIGKMW